MSHETPWDLAAKILDWNKRYAAAAAIHAARRRVLTDPYAAAALEIRRRGGSWADLEAFLNMAPGKAEREYGPTVNLILSLIDERED